MKRHPAPGIIRQPEPAIIRIDPMAVVAIGLPAGIVDDDGWPPAKSVTADGNPATVRREGAIKIIVANVIGRWRRLGNRLGGRSSIIGDTELLVALNHGLDDGVRHANVLQINNLVRSQIERICGIIGVTDEDALIHAGLREADDLGQRAIWVNVRRQFRLHRRGIGNSGVLARGGFGLGGCA